MRFYLGTHETSWLGKTDVPLFISHRRLAMRRSLPRARGGWGLDSGGFSELSMFGEWKTGYRDYLAAVRRYRDEIGNLEWAAPMDWMCEPVMTEKTELTVRIHQWRTVENFMTLRHLAPDLPIIPVLQGWGLADYMQCVEVYDKAGVDLRAEPLVGVGSVCRRQATGEIDVIMEALSHLGLRLHGFGVKALGFARYAAYLTSADSMAWSYQARREPPMKGHQHKSCANCMTYALRWREDILDRLSRVQLKLGLAS